MTETQIDKIVELMGSKSTTQQVLNRPPLKIVYKSSKLASPIKLPYYFIINTVLFYYHIISY